MDRRVHPIKLVYQIMVYDVTRVGLNTRMGLTHYANRKVELLDFWVCGKRKF